MMLLMRKDLWHMAKKKISSEPDPRLKELLDRYWKLIAREKVPKTPNISRILDELEVEIRKLKK